MAVVIINRSDKVITISNGVNIQPSKKLEINCSYKELLENIPGLKKLENRGYIWVSEDAIIDDSTPETSIVLYTETP